MITPISTEALSASEIAYNEGQAVGKSSGKIYGEKDYVNGKRSNWQVAYDIEERIVIIEFDLDKRTSSYRLNFLRGFKEEFKLSYEKAYKDIKDLNDNLNKTIRETGVDHGKIFGAMAGEIYGREDYHAGKFNNWKTRVPTEILIRRQYSLDNDTDKYAEGFILGYKNAFEESYTSTFRQTNIDNNRTPKENGTLHGVEMGFELGSVLGQIDFADKKNNNWQNVLPSNVDIMIEYNLMREVAEYRNGFLGGFKDGFRDGYIEAFQNANMDLGKDNINYQVIAMLGGQVSSSDDIMKLIVDPGTFYEEKHLSVQKGDFPVFNNNSYITVTNSYTIGIGNQNKTINLHNAIMLTFKYFGTERGGIYEFVDKKWRYLYSDIKNGEVSARLDSTTYSGGTYAVLIDNDYKELKDIHSNWAGQEIYTFIRRNYISGYEDRTFRAESNITRAEFITLLSRVMNWDTNVSHDIIEKFSDYNTFGVYKNVISKATSIGLINGYTDNTFKPNRVITYQEIEWIVQRLQNNNNFKWSEIEDKMMYEKYTRSKSALSKDNNITRAEVIYMLYHLQNEGKI